MRQVWNPSNAEIWVLERTSTGKYALAGRYDEGAFASIAYGKNKKDDMKAHMKLPLDAREVRLTDGSDAFSTDALAHLRAALPGERADRQRGKPAIAGAQKGGGVQADDHGAATGFDDDDGIIQSY